MPRFFFYSVRNYLIGRHSRAKIGTLLNNDSVNIGGWLAVEDPLLQSSPPFVREAPTRWLTVRLRGAFACVTFPCQKGRFQGAGLNFAQLVTVHAEASEVDDIFPLLPIPASSSCVCVYLPYPPVSLPFRSPKAAYTACEANRSSSVASRSLAPVSFKFALRVLAPRLSDTYSANLTMSAF